MLISAKDKKACFVIPKNVVEIAPDAFDKYEGLREFKLEGDSDRFSVVDGVLYDKSGARLLIFPAAKYEESFVVPEGVVEIAENAFRRGVGFERLTFPKSLAKVDSNAFTKLVNLVSIDVDEANSTFRSIDGVLYDRDARRLLCYPSEKSAETFDVPEGVVEIAENAFANGAACKRLTLPKSLTAIYEGAFDEFVNLISIDADEANPTYRSIDGVLYERDGMRLVAYPRQKTDVEYSVVDGSTELLARCFSKNRYLQTLAIPNSVKKIGCGAFSECTALVSLDMGDGVVEMDVDFCKLPTLRNLKLPKALTTLSNEWFPKGARLENLVLPEGIEEIPDAYFEEWLSLKSIVMPNGVKRIGANAFKGCEALTVCDFPRELERVEESAFEGCRFLEKADLSNCVKKIGSNAFKGCVALKSCNLSNELESIGDYAFARCVSLASIVVPSAVKNLGCWVFAFCESLKNAVVNASIDCLSSYAFYRCGALTDVCLTEGIRTIGFGAFQMCASLKTAPLPEALTTIQDDAFDGCAALDDVCFPKDLKEIGAKAFCRCSSLRKLDLPEGLSSIGCFAFYSCANLTSLSVPDSIEECGARAFRNCRNLQEVKLPGLAPFAYADWEKNLSEEAKETAIKYLNVYPENYDVEKDEAWFDIYSYESVDREEERDCFESDEGYSSACVDDGLGFADYEEKYGEYTLPRDVPLMWGWEYEHECRYDDEVEAEKEYEEEDE